MEVAASRLEGGHIWLPKKYRANPASDDNPKIVQILAPAAEGGHNRIPGLGFMSRRVRNHFVAMVGEFVGTFLFLFFAYSGTQVANTTNKADTATATTDIQKVLFISLCFGFSLAVNAWVFFRISGGLFNPAVTLGMCLVGAVPWFRGGLLLVSQLLGAISAAAVVSALFPGLLVVRTTLQAGTTIPQGLFIEMFLTAQLVFTIFMLAAEKHKATFIAPVGIGLSLFIAELTGVYFTGGSLNPARSLGPNVVLHQFEGYHWIYWLGPALGAIVAAGFYFLMKKLEYETANPNQDIDHSHPVTDEEKAMSEQDVPHSPRSQHTNCGSGHGHGNLDKYGTNVSDDTLRATSGPHGPPFGDSNYGYWVPVQRPDDVSAPPGAVLYMRQVDDHHTSGNGGHGHRQGQTRLPNNHNHAQNPVLTGEQASSIPTSQRPRGSSRGQGAYTDQTQTAPATAHDGVLRVNNVEYANDRNGLHAVHVEPGIARDIVGQDKDIARRKVT